MKVYQSEPEEFAPHMGDIKVTEEFDGYGRVYSLPFRLDLYNHSPTGFGWNYRGSGPAQTALALLADASSNDEVAVRFHQQFKDEIVVNLNGIWRLKEDFILEWLRKKGAKL